MAAPIFKDPELQRKFEKAGWVKLHLLEPEDIALLTRMYQHYFPLPPEGFFSSSYLDDYTLKKEISDAAAQVIKPRIDQYFQNHRVFGSAFLAKTAGRRSEMPMHQDWSIVDENQHVAVNIWTPLQDSDKSNGSLEVLTGSHAFAPVMRAPTIPFFWEAYTSQMKTALTPLIVKAGEAVVLNQAVVHYSPENTQAGARIAITTGLLNADAPMRFHHQHKPGELEIFAMEDDFLLRFRDFHTAIYERPSFGEVIGTMKYSHPNKTEAEILAFIDAAKPKQSEKKEWWKFWQK